MFYWEQDKEPGYAESLHMCGAETVFFQEQAEWGQDVTSISEHLSGSGLHTTPVFSLYVDCEITKTICRWGASQVALVEKSLPDNAGDLRDGGSTPGSGRSLRGGNETHSSIGLHRVGHAWSDLGHTHTHTHTHTCWWAKRTGLSFWFKTQAEHFLSVFSVYRHFCLFPRETQAVILHPM